MRDIIKHGAGRRLLELADYDLYRESGIPNNQVDTWVGGFNAKVITMSWVGSDKLNPMGVSETGAHAAPPIWIDFMGSTLAGHAQALPPRPENIVTVWINPKTDQRALHDGGILEILRRGHAPKIGQARHSGKHDSSNEVQQLFSGLLPFHAGLG